MNLHLREITFRDTVRAIFRKKFSIIITMAVVIVSVYIGLLLKTPEYEAAVKMHIKGQSQITAPTYRGIGAFRIHITQMTIVRSNPVLRRTVETLKLDKKLVGYEMQFCHKLKKMLLKSRLKKSKERLARLSKKKRREYLINAAVQNLKKRVTTQLIPNTDIFKIIVRDYSPEQAVKIANVISRSYTIYDQQQQLAELTLKYGDLHPAVEQLSNNINRMARRLSGKKLSTLEAIGTASVKIIEQATANPFPIGKSKTLILIIAIFVSGFLGLALALVFDYIDQTFKTPQDIVTYLDIPCIGSIAKKRFHEKMLLKDKSLKTRYARFYNDLATELYIFMKVQKLKTILILSSVSEKANSGVVPNLGFCISQEFNHETLIIDGNLKNPLFNNLLISGDKPGLGNLLEGGNGNYIEEIDNHLNCLPAGLSDQNIITLFDSDKMKELITEVSANYDSVIIDCTRVNDLKDVAGLSALVDGVVLVVNEGKERRQVVQNAIVPLKHKNVNLVGGILNNRSFKIPDFIYNRI